MGHDLSLPQWYRQDSVFARWQGREVTAAEFLQHVDFVAQNLPAAGAAVNLCEDRYLFIVSFVALMQRGQINVLPPNRAPQVVREVAAGYSDVYYLAEQALPNLLLPYHQVILPDGEIPTNGFMPLRINPEQVACVLYTSGSTGKPCPNQKSWRNLVTGAEATRKRLQLEQLGGATIVATVPAQHMFGLEMTVLLPLLAGCTVHAERPFFPEDIRRTLAALPEPRILVSTPLHLRACAGAGIDWPRVSQVISATAPLHRELARTIEHLFSCVVTEIYGSTETGALATRRAAVEETWRPLPDVEVRAGGDGVVVTAPYISGSVRLNDVLDMLSNNTFRLLGRDSDMINVAGKRASLGDLTHKLLQIHGVKDAVIIQQDEDGTGVGRLCALVVAPGLDAAVLQHELLLRFDQVFIPRPLYRVEQLPRNAAGKLAQADILAVLKRLRESHGTE